GVASISTNTLSAGMHSIVAYYLPTGNFQSSNDTLTQTVHPVDTSTKLTTSGSPALVGDTVNFTATVTSQTGALPAGPIVFQINTANPVKINLDDSGTARFSTNSLTAGSYAISANFSDGANFNLSGDALQQAVSPSGSPLTDGTILVLSSPLTGQSAPTG